MINKLDFDAFLMNRAFNPYAFKMQLKEKLKLNTIELLQKKFYGSINSMHENGFDITDNMNEGIIGSQIIERIQTNSTIVNTTNNITHLINKIIRTNNWDYIENICKLSTSVSFIKDFYRRH